MTTLYDPREVARRDALIEAWSPWERHLALLSLATRAPEAFDQTARYLAIRDAQASDDDPSGGA